MTNKQRRKLGRITLLRSVQNVGNNMVSLPVLEGAAIDARLLSNLEGIHLGIGEAFLLAGISESSVQRHVPLHTWSQNRSGPWPA